MRYIMHVYFQRNFYRQYDAWYQNNFEWWIWNSVPCWFKHRNTKIAHLKQTDCLGTDWRCTRQWTLQHVLLMRYIMHVYFQRNFYHQYDALLPESLLNDEFRFLC